MINVKSFSKNKISSKITWECYYLNALFLILLNWRVLGVGFFFPKVICLHIYLKV